jgi:uncharacterized Tic20 family protein
MANKKKIIEEFAYEFPIKNQKLLAVIISILFYLIIGFLLILVSAWLAVEIRGFDLQWVMYVGIIGIIMSYALLAFATIPFKQKWKPVNMKNFRIVEK